METKMGRPYGFVIDGPNLPGPLHLAAESEEELQAWVHALSIRARIKLNLDEDQEWQLKMIASVSARAKTSDDSSPTVSPFSSNLLLENLSSVKYTRTCDEVRKDRHRNNATIEAYQQASRWEGLLGSAASQRPLEGGKVELDRVLQLKQNPKELRALIHSGIPHRWRASMWLMLSGGQKLLQERPNLYTFAYQSTFSSAYTDDESLIDPTMVPLFGAEHFPLASCGLNPTGLKQAKVILCMLAQHNVEVDYCPTLPNLVCILLMYLSGAEAFAVAQSIIAQSKMDEHDRHTKDQKRWFIGTSRRRQCLLLCTFRTTANKAYPRLCAHLERIGIHIAHLAHEWFSTLFNPALPFPTALRLFDAFIAEGRKTLYRAGLSLLRLLEPELLKEDDSAKAEQMIRSFTTSWTNETRLFEGLFDFAVPTEELYKTDVQHVANADLANPALVFPHPLSTPFGQLYYRPTLEEKEKSQILPTFAHWELIYSWIPHPYCTRNPTLAYASYLHGASLQTLYHLCSPKPKTGIGAPASLPPAGSLLLVEGISRDGKETREAFGAFLPDRIALGHGSEYYCIRHSRLFSLTPEEALFPTIEDVDGNHLKRFVHFRHQERPLPSWTSETATAVRANSGPGGEAEDVDPPQGLHRATTAPVMSVTESHRQGTIQAQQDHLLIGHSGSPAAILVRKDAQSGSSQECPRFENRVFCGGEFTILKLEVYLLPL
eukprot:TRINITY_DN3098_c0_g1_i1.p1 TRINITY_DN3098_c0_g1~~TRINITY_DN3098_c0_g1_i1.p1  ORF type:complete len:799 (-),score=95.13 TRINITY_DN3098_c0_g1_i1:44-2194(-)